MSENSFQTLVNILDVTKPTFFRFLLSVIHELWAEVKKLDTLLFPLITDRSEYDQNLQSYDFWNSLFMEHPV